MLVHRERAGTFFRRTFLLYLILGVLSLLWVGGFILVTGVIYEGEQSSSPSLSALVISVLDTFRTVISQQPLLQVLVAGIIVGWASARFRVFLPIAFGVIRVSDGILRVFKWLLWYYPIMIGCLALLIPVKFGNEGISLYASTVAWLAIASLSWTMLMLVITKVLTERSWRQLLSYVATVYPTGFGTGGSYDTLAVNVLSAENDLRLSPRIAEIAIVFGTILNKSASTMGVMLCTVSVTRLLDIPLSPAQLAMLVIPLWILGLESPGIPGGAGVFMSPVVAAILSVPDSGSFISTFITMYSGLIPMLATGTNTVNDGFIGALLQDRFARGLAKEPSTSGEDLAAQASFPVRSSGDKAHGDSPG
jgi:Na+/H+-dicarboxylate symporter